MIEQTPNTYQVAGESTGKRWRVSRVSAPALAKKGDIMQKIIWPVIIVVFIVLSGNNAIAASYKKAAMLNKHGLIKEAKAELIEV